MIFNLLIILWVALHLRLHGHGASYVFSCILLIWMDRISQCVLSYHNGSIIQMSNLIPFVVLSSEISLDEILYY
jgi:hypothetical protein